jgi:hypothetical protein
MHCHVDPPQVHRHVIRTASAQELTSQDRLIPCPAQPRPKGPGRVATAQPRLGSPFMRARLEKGLLPCTSP